MKAITPYIVLMTACLALSAYAAEPENMNKSVVTVNKTNISQATYVDMLRSQVANGIKDSPQLRQAALDELVVTEALAQAATKAKLNTDADVKRAIENAQRKILAEAYMIKEMSKHPITEADAKAEYDRQVGMTKVGRNSVEYKISQIVVKDEATAQDVMKRLSAGEDFAVVAKETSIDKESAKADGALSWALPDQFVKPLGDVVVNLTKGQLAKDPIHSPIGWHIVKLDDSRPFKAPSFAQTKERMMQTLSERQKHEIVEAVMKSTDVKMH
jgi:peptidyl-prolyl cis-trans isomerase C